MVKMPLRSMYSLLSVKVLLIMPNFLFTQLVPGYRGYVVDSLRNLSYLDDVNISADEKHHFKGLSKRKGKKYIKNMLQKYFFCSYLIQLY